MQIINVYLYLWQRIFAMTLHFFAIEKTTKTQPSSHKHERLFDPHPSFHIISFSFWHVFLVRINQVCT